MATIEIDGYDMRRNQKFVDFTKKNKPVAIIANTIKGSGVSFMKDDNNWHCRIK